MNKKTTLAAVMLTALVISDASAQDVFPQLNHIQRAAGNCALEDARAGTNETVETYDGAITNRGTHPSDYSRYTCGVDVGPALINAADIYMVTLRVRDNAEGVNVWAQLCFRDQATNTEVCGPGASTSGVSPPLPNRTSLVVYPPEEFSPSAFTSAWLRVTIPPWYSAIGQPSGLFYSYQVFRQP